MGQDIDFPHDETERKSYYPGEYLVPIAKEFVKANPDCAKALTKDLTQEQLAKGCGVRNCTITAILRGQREPTIKTINKIAVCLNCSPSEIVEV